MAKLEDAIALGAIGETLGGSNPSVRTFCADESSVLFFKMNAGVAQLVECNLAKVDVTGSNPASRLINF